MSAAERVSVLRRLNPVAAAAKVAAIDSPCPKPVSVRRGRPHLMRRSNAVRRMQHCHLARPDLFALEIRGLVKSFSRPAVDRSRSRRARRRILRAARPERRRQDHDAAHDRRAVAARRRLDPRRRHRCARRSGRGQAAHGVDLRRADDLRQAHAARNISNSSPGFGASSRSSPQRARARAARLARACRRMRTSAARAFPRACGRKWRWPARWCTIRD